MTLDENIESAVAHLNAARPDEAAQIADGLLAEYPEDAQVHYLAGMAALALGNAEPAVAALRESIRLLPHFPDFWFALARALLMLGDVDGTVGALEESLRLNVSDKEATSLLAELYLTRGRRENALDVLKLGFAASPFDENLRESLKALAVEVGAPCGQRTDRPSEKSNDLVVLVCEIPRARERRLAEAIRQVGMRAVLLHRGDPDFDVGDYFEEIHRFRSCWQAVDIASRYMPLVYHVCNIWRYDTAAALIIARLGKVIVDCYDTMAGVMTAEFMDQWDTLRPHYELERFCLEHGDGICARNLYPQYAKRCYRITAPTLFYPEYCSIDRTAPRIEKLSAEDGEAHMVFGGTIWPERMYGLSEGAWLWFVDVAEQVGVHFHLYPVNNHAESGFDELFADYIEKDRSSRYFHLHKPVYGEAWTRELARYDYGVSFHYNHLRSVPAKLFTHFNSRACYSNKSTEYLELGIYHLANPLTLGAWLIEHYGVGEGVDWQRLHTDEFWRDLQTRVPVSGQRSFEMPRAWTIPHNADRLAAFYRRIADRVPAPAAPDHSKPYEALRSFRSGPESHPDMEIAPF